LLERSGDLSRRACPHLVGVGSHGRDVVGQRREVEAGHPHGRDLVDDAASGGRCGHSCQGVAKRRGSAQHHPVEKDKARDAVWPKASPQFDGDPTGVRRRDGHDRVCSAVVDDGDGVIYEVRRSEVTSVGLESP
jgi:hypothetical protein